MYMDMDMGMDMNMNKDMGMDTLELIQSKEAGYFGDLVSSCYSMFLLVTHMK